jgi:hypothetical protein
LNIPKLNGTARTGYYWQYKTAFATGTDPLSATDKSIVIDPDGVLSDFQLQQRKLDTLFMNKFVITPLDKAMDYDNAPVNVMFRSNYYIGGLNSALLSNNPWMQQTIGWQDFNGGMGTFDYRQ